MGNDEFASRSMTWALMAFTEDSCVFLFSLQQNTQIIIFPLSKWELIITHPKVLNVVGVKRFVEQRG